MAKEPSLELKIGKLTLSDDLDVDGDLCLDLEQDEWAVFGDVSFWINKEQAERIIAHLQEVFEL